MITEAIQKFWAKKLAARMIDPAKNYLTEEEVKQQYPDSINKMELKHTYNSEKVNFCYTCGRPLKFELTDHKSFDTQTGKQVRIFHKVCPVHHHKVEEGYQYSRAF